MDHQDWNNVKFNNVQSKEKKEKVNTNKAPNLEKTHLEAPKELGKTIAQARTLKKKNQKELATDLGISQQLLSRWESNKEIPTNAQIALMEKKLGVKLPRCKKVKNDD